MHGKGGMHGRGCVWQGVVHSSGMCGREACTARGACVAGGVRGMHAPHLPQILRDTINERSVRILLECILVIYIVLDLLG